MSRIKAKLKVKFLYYIGFQRTFFSPLMRGNFPYFCPGGWLRLSLNVAES